MPFAATEANLYATREFSERRSMIDLQYEHVIPDQSSSFRCYHRVCHDLTTDHPWHFHPEFELSWVIRSSGVRYVGNYIKPYVPNEVVLYGPDLPHCSRNDAAAPEGAVVEYITLQFDLGCFGQGFLDVPEAAAIRGLLGDSRRAVMFAPDASRLVGPHLRKLVKLTGMSRIIKLAEILNMLSTIKRNVLTSPDYAQSVVVDNKLIEHLNKVQRYIDERFRGIVSQAEIAEQIDMTPSAFSKFIRASTGQTFMSMVRTARINEACRLLAYSDSRITDIALECGYQHTSHFDRSFLEEKGMSPTDYRKRASLLGQTQKIPAVLAVA